MVTFAIPVINFSLTIYQLMTCTGEDYLDTTPFDLTERVYNRVTKYVDTCTGPY